MPLRNANVRHKDHKSCGVSFSPKHNSPRAPYSKPLIATQQLKKPRSFEQRIQKKSLGLAGKENEEQQLVKYTPKAILLTPSSSDNSLTTTLSSGRVINCKVLTKDVAKKKPVADNAIAAATPYLSLKRQKSAAILCFRSRKSLSQMDFKEVRRTGNSQVVARFPGTDTLEPPAAGSETANSLTIMLLKEPQLISKDWQVQMLLSSIRPRVERAVNIRIFNSLVLWNWRRRWNEVNKLREQMEDSKRNYVKIRNQLHVCNMVFSVDKRRNEILNEKLVEAQRCKANQDILFENLQIMFEETKEEKEKLSQKLAEKEQDNENLQQLLDTVKNDLFHANTEQRLQLEQLTQVQREYQEMRIENHDLTKDLEVVSLELTLKTDNAEQLRKDVANISQQLSLALQNLKQYKRMSEEQMKEQHDRTLELERSVQQKKEQVTTLENCLAATVGQRIRRCLNQTQTYQELHHVVYDWMDQHENATKSQLSVNTRRSFWAIFAGQKEKRRRTSFLFWIWILLVSFHLGIILFKFYFILK